MVEYLAESEKRRAHSAKLKALRLTKEAEDLAAANALPPKKRSSRKSPKK